MRIGLRHFGLLGGVVGLLAAMTEASTPTFEIKLAGIKKVGQEPVIFRDLPNPDNPRDECNTDPAFDECPALAGPGSTCVPTEIMFTGFYLDHCSPIADVVPLLCEGGPTPGEPCQDHTDCEPGGTCSRSFVEPGDQIVLEVFLSGWDDDPDNGVCNSVSDPYPCVIGGEPCPGKHCHIDHFGCTSPADCVGTQLCVDNWCVVSPLLGGYQWTIDSSTYAGDSGNTNAALYPAPISCSADTDCHHGRISGGGQCTCGVAVCDPVFEICSSEAIGYIDLIRGDFVFRDLPGGDYVPVVSTLDADYAYSVATAAANPELLEDPQRQKYVGTLWLQVPNQAAGTYDIGFKTGEGHTFATNEVAQVYPAVEVKNLEINIIDPCAEFDLDQCGEPTNVCRKWVCQAINGVPTCVELPRDCVEEFGPGYLCVVGEGGCVQGAACCMGPVQETCRVKSELECESLNGVWLFDIEKLDCGPPNPCVEPPNCTGPVQWNTSIPPSGVLDAGQPRDVHDGTLQGIDTIVVTGEAGSENRCFVLCETLTEDTVNEIADVVEDPDGTYTITLDRRITPGAATTITFDELGYDTSGWFKFLPGDVNADQTSDIEDIVEMVDCCLNQNCTPVHGEYSCDLDRSGGTSGADVLRLIDLLTGAGELTMPWDGEQLDPYGCPR